MATLALAAPNWRRLSQAAFSASVSSSHMGWAFRRNVPD